VRRALRAAPVCRCAGCRPANGCYSSDGTGGSKLPTRFWTRPLPRTTILGLCPAPALPWWSASCGGLPTRC
jgi:hypothetical protein